VLAAVLTPCPGPGGCCSQAKAACSCAVLPQARGSAATRAEPSTAALSAWLRCRCDSTCGRSVRATADAPNAAAWQWNTSEQGWALALYFTFISRIL
jgi:hypothetical protein